MKKILLYAVMLFAAIGCQKSLIKEDITAPSDGLITVTVQAEMPDSSSDTRVGVTPDGDGWKTEWEDGDKLVLVPTANNNADQTPIIYELTTMNKLDGDMSTFSGEVAAGSYDVYCIKDYTQEPFAIDYSKQIISNSEAYSNVPMKALGSMTVEADANNSFTSPLLHFEYVAQVVDITLDVTTDLSDTSYTLSSIELSGFASEDGSTSVSMGVAEGIEFTSSTPSQVISCYLPAFTVNSSEALTVNAAFTAKSTAIICGSTTAIENSGSEDVVFEAGKHNTIYVACDEIKNSNWIDFAAATFAGGVAYDDATLSYSISTAEEFALLAKLVKVDGKSMEGKTFTLANDIDLSGREWTAIGHLNYPFYGIFDGANHTVEGLYINKHDNYQQGLFGYTSSATIKDLSVSGKVAGINFIGGIVGNSNHSTIINCYSSVDVSGASHVGGIVGGSDSTVTNCYSSGEVSGDNTVGGVVGSNTATVFNCYSNSKVSGSSTNIGGIVGYNSSSTGKVINCYSNGEVSGSDFYIGGIVGWNQENATVTNCYSSSKVSGRFTIGGIVGLNEENATVTNCYSSGEVSAYSEIGGVVGLNDNNATVTNCYWDSSLDGAAQDGIGNSQDGATSSNVEGMTTDEMQASDFLIELNDNACAYNYSIKDDESAVKARAWVAVDGGYPTFDYDAEPTYTVVPFEGEGTESNPYKIATAEDMRQLSRNVNLGKESYHGKYLELQVNIDLGGMGADGNTPTAEKEFTAIGSQYNIFQGIFDGAGHTIEGLYINQPEALFQGLFGRIFMAAIKNLSVAGRVTGDGDTAGIVGLATEYSTVINCYNAVSVVGGSAVGGVVGYLASSAVANCYNTASVEGDDNLGSIVGYLRSSTVTNCYWDSSITGAPAVGHNSSDSTSSNIVGMTTAAMQSSGFAVLLNNGAYTYNQTSPKVKACAWKATQSGYPTFDYDAEPTFTQIGDVEPGVGM